MKRSLLRTIVKVRKNSIPITSFVLLLGVFALFQNCGSKNAATSTTTGALTSSPTPNPPTTGGITISPSSSTVSFGSSTKFSASGGTGSYTFSVSSGTGRITATGVFTAPNVNESDLVVVTDDSGASASTSVTVSNGTTVTSGPVTIIYRAQDHTGSSLTATFSVGSHPCSNNTFGNDPSFGHYKACYLNSTAIVPENENFIVNSDGSVSPDLSGNRHIKPTSANLCLGVAGASNSDGAGIIQWNCLAGHTDQQWTFSLAHQGQNTFNLVDVQSSKIIAVAGGSIVRGAQIIQWPNTGTLDQIWQLIPFNNGYQIKNFQSGYCLGVNSASTAPGAGLIQWTCDGSANQTFTFPQ